jgi:hypothetical protein
VPGGSARGLYPCTPVCVCVRERGRGREGERGREREGGRERGHRDYVPYAYTFIFFLFLLNFHSLEEVFPNDLHHLSRTHTRLAPALTVLTVSTVG